MLVSLPQRAELLSLISARLIFVPSMLSVLRAASGFSQRGPAEGLELQPNDAPPKSAGSRHTRERNLNTRTAR